MPILTAPGYSFQRKMTLRVTGDTVVRTGWYRHTLCGAAEYRTASQKLEECPKDGCIGRELL